MTGRVICFGATGYTGRLTAEAMVRAGLAPVLAGRSADALVKLTGDLAGLGPMDRPATWQAADALDHESVRALVQSPDDVLVSTVGPFSRFGRAAIEAAIDTGCSYVDSTGEPGFIRHVFEVDGPRAEETGARLLTAFGYDYVPGNLAAVHALADAESAGRAPTSVEVGYFVRGGMGMSSGTRASMAGVLNEPPFARRNGELAATAGEVMTFDVRDKQRDALPVGGSEHFTIPRIDERILDVSVGLGWAGSWTRTAHRVGSAAAWSAGLPGVGKAVRAGVEKATSGETGIGPTAEERASARTLVVARTKDGVGRVLSQAVVEGIGPYDLTAELLAWGAAMLLTGRALHTGALGPADAFGSQALIEGCDLIGLRRVD